MSKFIWYHIDSWYHLNTTPVTYLSEYSKVAGIEADEDSRPIGTPHHTSVNITSSGGVRGYYIWPTLCKAGGYARCYVIV